MKPLDKESEPVKFFISFEVKRCNLKARDICCFYNLTEQ